METPKALKLTSAYGKDDDHKLSQTQLTAHFPHNASAFSVISKLDASVWWNKDKCLWLSMLREPS